MRGPPPPPPKRTAPPPPPRKKLPIFDHGDWVMDHDIAPRRWIHKASGYSICNSHSDCWMVFDENDKQLRVHEIVNNLPEGMFAHGPVWWHATGTNAPNLIELRKVVERTLEMNRDR